MIGVTIAKKEYVVAGLEQPADGIAFVVTPQSRYYSIVPLSGWEHFIISILEQKVMVTMKKIFPTLEEAVAFVKAGGEDSKAYQDESMRLLHEWKELARTTPPIVFSGGTYTK